jgi:hypothetical protein
MEIEDQVRHGMRASPHKPISPLSLGNLCLVPNDAAPYVSLPHTRKVIAGVTTEGFASVGGWIQNNTSSTDDCVLMKTRPM